MNILIIPSWYNTDNNPTNGSFFREQVYAIKEKGNNVIVAFVEVRLLSDKICKNKVKVIDDNGIKTYRIIQGKIPKTGNIGTAIAFREGLKKIYKEIIKEENIDIVHLHSCIWGGLGGIFVAKKLRVPLIITEHSSYYGRFNVNFFERQIIKYSFKNASKVISVSKYLKETISKYYIGNIDVIPNMVDCSEFSYCRSKTKSSNDKFTFLSLCYLKANKGVDILIRAFSKYFKGEEVVLVVAGDGPEKANLEKLALELDISEQIIFKGALSREEVKNEMSNCNAFVLASRFETFGVVLIEALASGKPVISTRNGGANDIINDLNGMLVDIDNIDEFGEKMYYMYRNYNMYDSYKIMELCNDIYSKERIIQKLLNIYGEINGK
ncbi:MAG: glycosyltransferase [Clostridium sp.]|uniref:glycosyltransferase n=1 Tax=Clostridium sp. TaxID=1506 RepID=UPI0025BA399A|nr:glycosyltransferase [Clostridium sp.]MCF0147277.1 glycosyltransferase [Clostridium sp.]